MFMFTKTLRDGAELVIWVVVCEAVGFVGSWFTTAAIPVWYVGLAKPFFAPPNWVFAPVWTTLYLLMGVAAWLVWRQRHNKTARRAAMLWFGAQLVLNAVWSPVFFGQQNIFGGLVVIGLLWLAIMGTIIVFARRSLASAWLLVPYLAWVSLASLLNYSLWVLN